MEAIEFIDTEWRDARPRPPSSELKMLLKHFRVRIDPRAAALGPHPRAPWRQGKPVTQQELAECIGVSRTWYGKLECDTPVRASIVLLDRLARVLMLSPGERAMLFVLALPELNF